MKLEILEVRLRLSGSLGEGHGPCNYIWLSACM